DDPCLETGSEYTETDTDPILEMETQRVRERESFIISEGTEGEGDIRTERDENAIRWAEREIEKRRERDERERERERLEAVQRVKTNLRRNLSKLDVSLTPLSVSTPTHSTTQPSSDYVELQMDPVPQNGSMPCRGSTSYTVPTGASIGVSGERDTERDTERERDSLRDSLSSTEGKKSSDPGSLLAVVPSDTSIEGPTPSGELYTALHNLDTVLLKDLEQLYNVVPEDSALAELNAEY
ncbi:hypothetical protein KIPB_010885, partial [Kipferlia bialata]